MSHTTESTYPSAATTDAGATGSGGGAASDVLGSAKDEAAQVTREATQQVKTLWREAQSDLTGQAASQQTRATEGLRELAGQLQRMIDESSAEGPARDLVASTARRGRDAAEWLDNRDPGSLLEEARGFARRRPGAFLALAAGVGLLAGRLTRGLNENGDDDTGFEGSADPARSPSSMDSGFSPYRPAAAQGGMPAAAGRSPATPVAGNLGRESSTTDDVGGVSTGSLRTTTGNQPFDIGRGSDLPETDIARGAR